MRILHLVNSLGSGGAQKFVVELCNELSDTGHKVAICTLYPLKIKEYNFFEYLVNNEVSLFSLNKNLGFSLKALFDLNKIIKEFKPDIIHSHLDTNKYLLLNIPFVKGKYFHTIHNDAFKEANKYLRKVRGYFIKKNILIPITISQASHLSYNHAYHNDNAVLIENGVAKPKLSKDVNQVKIEIDSLKKSKETTVFLNVGRIVKQKNQMRLLNVAKKLNKQGHDIVVLIIGANKNDDIYEALVNEKVENVYFLGEKTNVSDYLINSDAFCLSSDYEGLPISLLESISLGVIPVCTPAGGVKNIIKDEELGFLADEISDDSLFLAVVEFLKSSIEKRKIMKDKCIDTYNSLYSMKVVANKHLELYQKEY